MLAHLKGNWYSLRHLMLRTGKGVLRNLEKRTDKDKCTKTICVQVCTMHSDVKLNTNLYLRESESPAEKLAYSSWTAETGWVLYTLHIEQRQGDKNNATAQRSHFFWRKTIYFYKRFVSITLLVCSLPDISLSIRCLLNCYWALFWIGSEEAVWYLYFACLFLFLFVTVRLQKNC